MWSKQADVRNANMTSFKNKITNRKQKNSKPGAATAAATDGQSADNSVTNVDKNAAPDSVGQSGRKQKSGKNRNRSSKKTTTPPERNPGPPKEESPASDCPKDDIIATSDDLDLADVELRNTSSAAVNSAATTTNTVAEQNLKNCSNGGLKRYSDSFVIDNLIPEELSTYDKAARKGRRLSDFFRTGGGIKPTVSMESLSLRHADDKSDKVGSKIAADKATESKTNKRGKKGDAAENNKSTPIKESKHSLSKESKNAKNLEKASPFVKPSCDTNSYLKRVKSKIYKTKTETEVLPSKTNMGKKSKTCDRIPEETPVKADPRRSLYFDFRLIRQTSNLEQVRTKTLGAKPVSNSASCDCEPTQRPALTKAKSSSAINLNLLRTRRNRILEQVKERRCKDVFDEFDFIAFGGFRDKFGGSQRISSVIHEHQPPGEETQIGENKPSQPVSRSGSDRRPDVVREEISKTSEGTTTAEHHVKQEADASAVENASSFPSTNSKKRSTSNINRSESVKEQTEKRKQRRNFSDPSHNTTTSGDVELDQPGLSNTESGSSSNSSISYNGRLSESPSNSADAVVADGGGAGKKTSSDLESDTEVEEPTNWQKLFPEEELRNLQPHEKKRQDVINELFHTEHTHVRNLKVLYKIFYKALAGSQVLKPDELSLIFPNIKDTLNVHTHFNNEMRRKRREDPLVGNLGNMLADMFGGSTGESLQKAAATFCERQQLALEFIKERRKRDSKFDAVLVECEKSPSCRRLPLQGIMPTEMQRLSKYPLLLERLISSLEADGNNPQAQEELVKLRRAHQSSKEILNYVNEAAKLAWNRARLEDIQRHLDSTNFERSDHAIAQEFRTMDLTRYRLIVEGNMQLRRPNKGIIPVHVLLLEEAVVILHKESERYILKFFQSGSSAQPQPLSPIIKMSTLLVRNNAVCKNALFLVNTSTNNSQMYDLLAEDDIKRDVWFKHFSDASDTYNKREGKTKRPEPPPDSDESETVQDLPIAKDVAERAEAVGGTDKNPPEEEEEGEDDEPPFSDAHEDEIMDSSSREAVSSSEGGGVHTRVTADEWPLIPPSQVHIADVPPVHTAESRLTPLEQIRRKDEEVRRALEDKQGLVADLLSIPREDFQVIADIAGDDHERHLSKDLAERVMAAIYQVDQLHLAVNESLNVTEAATVTVTGGKHPACQSQEVQATAAVPPSIPVHRVRDIANVLSSQLTTLLSEVKSMDEDRARLRKELHRMRETLHEQHHLHGPNDHLPSPSHPPEAPLDLESAKENPTESES